MRLKPATKPLWKQPVERTPLRGKRLKAGKKTKKWRAIKAKGDKKLFESNQVYCLVCGSSDVTPAHAWRRHHSTESMLSIYAPLCLTHHHRLDALGERYSFPLISYLAECARFEREPEIDFGTASRDELKAFAERLMSDEEFFALRRTLTAKK